MPWPFCFDPIIETLPEVDMSLFPELKHKSPESPDESPDCRATHPLASPVEIPD
jgi:hypothetical protein